jgi:hypothetical protein
VVCGTGRGQAASMPLLSTVVMSGLRNGMDYN